MLLSAAILILQQQQTAAAPQVWQKLVAPGVTYRMEVDPSIPLIFNAVRFSPSAAGLSLVGELSGGQVFDPAAENKGTDTITHMALRTGSLVAVNGDFFPYTGDPLGAMVIDGELISSAKTGRATFCWGSTGSVAAYLESSADIKYAGNTVPINGVNMQCGDDMLTFFTDKAGYAVSEKLATFAILDLPYKITPNGVWKATVKRVIKEVNTEPLEKGECAIVYSGSRQEPLAALRAGEDVQVHVSTTGVDLEKFPNVVGGGPFLVKEGQVFAPFADEGFTQGFADKRHPRTAIGRTNDGDVWLVTFDGRQEMSAGVSIQEEAEIMRRLGCVDAINLDGGGSSTLNIGSVTLNRPSEGGERPVASALLILRTGQPEKPASQADGTPPVIAGPAKIMVGETAQYHLVQADGTDVPNERVLWSAQGGAWIDQSGLLHGAAEGSCFILVYSSGQIVSLTVQVTKETDQRAYCETK
ncbi:MAG TPA: phosphodiester glycosidase family protein [Fimbriimonadaceae bacterium]|nr:phosphodiester glycosidase family protein [Fimbriimonadaceae bacterium]